MSECIDDMTALSQLKDSVVDIIRHDPNPLLQKSKDILRRIDERQLVSIVTSAAVTHIQTWMSAKILDINPSQKYNSANNNLIFTIIIVIFHSVLVHRQDIFQ